MKECYKPKISDEIQKASEEYILKIHIDNASVQDHFIAGAEWMQKRMIEKVAEWMRNFKDGQGNFPLYDYVGNFKQAMQDESK